MQQKIRRRQTTGMHKHARGIGLIEVMVSVLVLGLGLLGVAAMQSLAMRGGQGSLESSQAVMQTTSIFESMRANRANAASYNIAKTCAVAGVSGVGGLAGADLTNWLTALKSTMGTAGDSTTCAQIAGCPNACVVTVYWDDRRAGGAADRTVITRTRI